MTFGEKLYQYLSKNDEVATLVGSRIYPNIAPSGADSPYAVYTLVSDVARYTLGGNARVSSRRVQISVYGDNYVKVEEIGKAISDVLDDWSDTDNEVQSVSRLNQVDKRERETDLYCKILDFSVFY